MRCCALWRPDFCHFEGFRLPIRWISRAIGLLQQARKRRGGSSAAAVHTDLPLKHPVQDPSDPMELSETQRTLAVATPVARKGIMA